MGLREHIFDLQAAVYVPLRNVMSKHILLHFLGKKLGCVSFTGYLHNFKGQLGIKSVVNEVCHNAVTCSDNIGNCADIFLDKLLCITQPNIGTM